MPTESNPSRVVYLDMGDDPKLLDVDNLLDRGVGNPSIKNDLKRIFEHLRSEVARLSAPRSGDKSLIEAVDAAMSKESIGKYQYGFFTVALFDKVRESLLHHLAGFSRGANPANRRPIWDAAGKIRDWCKTHYRSVNHRPHWLELLAIADDLDAAAGLTGKRSEEKTAVEPDKSLIEAVDAAMSEVHSLGWLTTGGETNLREIILRHLAGFSRPAEPGEREEERQRCAEIVYRRAEMLDNVYHVEECNELCWAAEDILGIPHTFGDWQKRTAVQPGDTSWIESAARAISKQFAITDENKHWNIDVEQIIREHLPAITAPIDDRERCAKVCYDLSVDADTTGHHCEASALRCAAYKIRKLPPAVAPVVE